METIGYTIKKYSSVRLLIAVLLSLGMAVLLGTGLQRPLASNIDFDQLKSLGNQPRVAEVKPAVQSLPTNRANNMNTLARGVKDMANYERSKTDPAAATKSGTNSETPPATALGQSVATTNKLAVQKTLNSDVKQPNLKAESKLLGAGLSKLFKESNSASPVNPDPTVP